MSPWQPVQRIGDDDRRRVLDLLTRFTGSGHLNLTDFEERSRLVAAARTREDLDAVVADLPLADTPVPAVREQAAPPPLSDSRKIAAISVSFLGVLAIAAVTGLPWLMLLALAIPLIAWLSGRGPSGFYDL